MVDHRFWSRVDKAGPTSEHRPELGPCWIWLGQINSWGYGRFQPELGKRNRKMAHKYLWESLHGPVPSPLCLDHLCRNIRCVNPSHLEAVTQRENTLRGIGPAAIRAKAMLCKRGHPLSGGNLMRKKTRYGHGRECRICSNASKRESRKRSQGSGE